MNSKESNLSVKISESISTLFNPTDTPIIRTMVLTSSSISLPSVAEQLDIPISYPYHDDKDKKK